VKFTVMANWRRALLQGLGLLVLSWLALQLFWFTRIAVMTTIDPHSTSFERSEIWRLLTEKHRLPWSQQWRDYDTISDQLKRAVIASEDANFSEHSGVEWDAIEKAWERNQKAEARADKVNEVIERRERQAQARAQNRGATPPAPARRVKASIFGGSTITQQLAKNLFLSGERSILRKGQEFLITFMLEAMLDKPRILEIYLNHVEWGEGVFGAEAAARHYFQTEARRLAPGQAARLAVMLPAPKRFEKTPQSAYLSGRSATVVARMPAVDLP
jgi:monofunctional biosynthetic peptidoglycan transglycosylase